MSTRITALQREVTDADEKLKRLYRLVEDRITDLDEVLKDRLNTLKSGRDRASAALVRAGPNAGSPIQIDPALIEQFGRTMRENFTTGSVPFRRDVRPIDVTAWPLEIGEARRAAALIGIL